MKRTLFFVCVVLAIFGCGGDMDDLPPCLTCGLCGSQKYYPTREFCFETTVYAKCGSRDYNPSTQFCSGGSVYVMYSSSSSDMYIVYSSSINIGYSSSIMDNEPSSSSERPSSPSIEPSSSSSPAIGNSSSSVLAGPSYAYCIKEGSCLEGPFTLSECVDVIKGSPSNNCTVAPSSSSAVAPPSSSSSSPAPSSSSSVPLPSSSSSVPLPSSSSIAPSSSSIVSGGKGNSISSYRTVVIGTQTWMAENFDYAVEGSKCHSNQESYCNTYGRLYDWATAMALPSSCNSTSCSSQIGSPHRGICPSGWHIPSQTEWNTLSSYVRSTSGCGSCDARLLKATSGWNNNGNGTDEFGFSALPGGYGNSEGSFGSVGSYGYWWSASEYDSYYAYFRYMFYDYEYAYWSISLGKSYLFSVRCLQD